MELTSVHFKNTTKQPLAIQLRVYAVYALGTTLGILMFALVSLAIGGIMGGILEGLGFVEPTTGPMLTREKGQQLANFIWSIASVPLFIGLALRAMVWFVED